MNHGSGGEEGLHETIDTNGGKETLKTNLLLLLTEYI